MWSYPCMLFIRPSLRHSRFVPIARDAAADLEAPQHWRRAIVKTTDRSGRTHFGPEEVVVPVKLDSQAGAGFIAKMRRRPLSRYQHSCPELSSKTSGLRTALGKTIEVPDECFLSRSRDVVTGAGVVGRKCPRSDGRGRDRRKRRGCG